ncbi:SCO family protein [Deinococcus actinosclerus]|uniref:Electron transporter n=1 Tax=Deinococcus actinosclerus TaxID=1768108 RepID=A0ABN4KA76_9DEIO|nr:SCO family protein [Deinococcus actinosclerus]ALW89984.1 electron transporter [Deinococcus actinosclerus]
MTGVSRWVTAALLVVAAVLGGLLVMRRAAPGVTAGEALDAPKALPALALVNDRGQATTLAASDGRMRLVFYGFVRCPDVCPATLASLKNMYAALSPEQRSRVQVQFITVDPGHDTPGVMREYLNRFDPAFTGLTGKPGTIDAAAREMFVANVAPMPAEDHSAHMDMEQGKTSSGAANAVQVGAAASVAARIHGDQVSVVDGQGRFVRVYGNLDVVGGDLERDLPGLIRQYAGR